MSVKLNQRAFDHAKRLIEEGHVVVDDRDAWSEHRPTSAVENEFIEAHGLDEFARWHLGVDDEETEGTKGRCKFPYGDFDDVHRCALLSAEVRAGQYKYADIERAAADLHGMVDAATPARRR